MKRYWVTEKLATKMECKVLWDTGERLWEPVNVLRKDNPITLAKYAAENGLSNQRQRQDGSKWARNITKNPKKYKNDISHWLADYALTMPSAFVGGLLWNSL